MRPSDLALALDLLAHWSSIRTRLRLLVKEDPSGARLVTDNVLRDCAELSAGGPMVIPARSPVMTSAIDEKGRFRVIELAQDQRPDDVLRPGWRWATPDEIKAEDARSRERRSKAP